MKQVISVNRQEDRPLKNMKVKKLRQCNHELAAFNQLYVINSRPHGVYLKHANKIIQKGIETIIIHGMQNSIQKAVQVALDLVQQNPDMTQSVITDSVPTIVQLADGSRELRERSAIHITLRKQLSF